MTVVAIDGPAGAGKSTVARLAAERLGYRHVDTGALYRALAAAALDRGVDPGDGPGLAKVASALELSFGRGRIAVDGVDVTDRLRSEEVTAIVSRVSEHPEVRACLLDVQRALAEGGGVVVEGRDIGSRVIPNADVKVFLTADLEERARRRALEMGLAAGTHAHKQVAGALADRDRRDSGRPHSPLLKAPDAAEIDTTAMSLEEVIAEVVDLVRRVGRHRA